MTTTTTATKMTWYGKSGVAYEYHIYPFGTSFREAPGNYIFAMKSKPNTWRPIYVGETSNLAERFDNHHKMPCIKRNGATHIHVRINRNGEVGRRMEEKDLMSKYGPVCNG